jgi:hypothetical protein
MRAEASSKIFVPACLSFLISVVSASGSKLIPIPIEAESAFFGSIAMSRFAEPFVSLSSGKGRAIIAGENDLTAVIIERGTAV